jgi:hypothetical protein
MLPFRDKGGGLARGIGFHESHERRVDGFASETEALDRIIANSKQVDKEPP